MSKIQGVIAVLVINFFKRKYGVNLIVVTIVDSTLLISGIISAFLLFEGHRILRVRKISEAWHHPL